MAQQKVKAQPPKDYQELQTKLLLLRQLTLPIRFVGSIAIGAKNIFLDPALRKITGRVPAPVEREIIDILNTSGLSLDDFFAGVKSGKILSELGEGTSKATKEALGVLQTKGGAGADLMHQRFY